MTPPAETPAPRRRRALLGLALAFALAGLAGRIALPDIARRTLGTRATALVHGEVRVGDVDFELLRGRVALEDVSLRAADAAPGAPPVVALRRIAADIAWLPLLERTVTLQGLDIEGLSVYVTRLANGALALPGVDAAPPAGAGAGDSAPAAPPESSDAPPPSPTPVEPAAAAEESTPWGVVIERLRFADGALRLDDRVATPPVVRTVTLPALRFTGFRLRPAPGAEPGRGRVRIQLDDGVVEARARVRPVEGGFDVAVAIEAIDVPIDRLHEHVPSLGWRDASGRLDALLSARIAPGAPLVARGDATLENVAITLPGRTDPALAWRSLSVELDRADLAKRTVRVAAVALDGGRVVVDPAAAAPIPVFAQVGGGEEDDAPEEAAPAWTWEVADIGLRDTHADVLLEGGPLDVHLRAARVRGLAGGRAAGATVDAEIGVAGGTLHVEGPFTLDPPGATLQVRATDVDAGRLAALAPALPAPLAARLDASLEVTARQDPLTVRGEVVLRDVETMRDEGETFLLAWDRLALDIDRATVPGVLGGGAGGVPEPVTVAIGTATLDRPRLVTVRTADGMLLPEPSAVAGEAPSPPPEAASPPPEDSAGAAPPPAAPGVRAVIDRLIVREGDVRFTDMTVTPPYRGHLARLAVDARGIRIPENRADRVTLTGRAGRNAPVTVSSVRRGDTIRIAGTLRNVPLAQFDPYAAAYGYRIAGGTLDLESDTALRAEDYDSENLVALDGLALRGSEGETLFKDTVGVPLGVALALLRDRRGRITLGVPVAGDREGTTVGIGAIVREALRKALVGALTSPLKLLGALPFGGGDAGIESVDPAPIEFVAGTARIARSARTRAARLGAALASFPALRVRLSGRAGPRDARALAEADVLADLEAGGGVLAGIRAVFGGGERARIRDALRARARGQRGELGEEDAARLDALVAERPVATERLRALARERAEVLAALLRDTGGRPDQILLDDPQVRRKTGASEVDVRIDEPPVGEGATD